MSNLIKSAIMVVSLTTAVNGYATEGQGPDPLSASVAISASQGAICTGTVIDPQGEPVIGANVKVKGATKGVLTDIDGKFTLDKVPNGTTLVVSYVGAVDTEAVWHGTPLTITLKDSSTALDEVVVVGYGTQKKANLTGSVASVSAKDLEDTPVANTATLLQGRVAGMVLTSNGAQAGNDNPEIRIRGVGTFGNNNPMLLIDGVEASLSQLGEIPANDIENISVLKDAASAAIYGVRAANGVILVTTKQGQEGKTRVNYSGSYTIQTHGTIPNYIHSWDWAQMRNEVEPGAYTDAEIQKMRDGSDPDHYADTDWLGAVLRTAGMQQHNLSVSGGNKDNHYMASVGYLDQDGIVKGTALKQISFRTNLDTRLERFTFGVNASGNKRDVDAPGMSITGESGVMRQVSWFTRPTVPIMYSNGHYGYVDGSNSKINNAEYVKNFFETINVGYNNNYAWRFNGKAWAAFDIWDGLKIQTSFAYNYYNNTTKSYSPKSNPRYNAEGEILKIAGQNNNLRDYFWLDETWTNENLLTYNNTFAEKHNLSVLLGHSLIGNKYRTDTANKQGFPTENIYEFNGGTKNPTVSGYSGEYHLQSFFGRVNYVYDSKYLFEFNIRHDGSSRMPKKNRYATFPSVSAGWVFTQEKFLEDYYWMFGKLRASWGKLGNQEIGSYAYVATLAASGNYYFDQGGDPVPGMVQNSVPNDNIKWETTRTWNVGLDLAFLNNRITATFDWYDKKTSDILMQLAMPGIFLGNLAAPYQNVGEVRNSGFDLALGYNDHAGDFTWYANANLSHVKNEVLAMGDLEERISGSTINRVGEPIGAFYAMKAIGIYRTEADLNRTNSEGKVITQNGAVPSLGDIMYADTNDDGDANSDDRVIIGNPFPKFNYGFSFGGTWKGFDLSAFWQGVAGLDRYVWETTSDIRGNFTERFLDRWSPDNPNGSMPRLGNAINDTYSSFWLEDASYLRLKNLEVGYTFKPIPALRVTKLRLYFSATNLLTFTHLKNWDPERSSGDSRGDVHPSSRTYSFGVNLSF